jgi:hypothetical protein
MLQSLKRDLDDLDQLISAAHEEQDVLDGPPDEAEIVLDSLADELRGGVGAGFKKERSFVKDKDSKKKKSKNRRGRGEEEDDGNDLMSESPSVADSLDEMSPAKRNRKNSKPKSQLQPQLQPQFDAVDPASSPFVTAPTNVVNKATTAAATKSRKKAPPSIQDLLMASPEEDISQLRDQPKIKSTGKRKDPKSSVVYRSFSDEEENSAGDGGWMSGGSVGDGDRSKGNRDRGRERGRDRDTDREREREREVAREKRQRELYMKEKEREWDRALDREILREAREERERDRLEKERLIRATREHQHQHQEHTPTQAQAQAQAQPQAQVAVAGISSINSSASAVRQRIQAQAAVHARRHRAATHIQRVYRGHRARLMRDKRRRRLIDR